MLAKRSNRLDVWRRLRYPPRPRKSEGSVMHICKGDTTSAFMLLDLVDDSAHVRCVARGSSRLCCLKA